MGATHHRLRRAEWVFWRAGIDPHRLFFIDETWAKTKVSRLRGRARRGVRLLAKAPHGHWSTTTLIGALGVDGVRCSMLVDGPVNGELLQAFVDQILRGLAARTQDILWRSMQSVLDTVTPSDSVNYFKHCGYSLQTN